MTFTGFPEPALDFYEGLEADNTKAYWTDHKAVYDECVAAPMKALLASLEPTFGTAKMFRPYRDVRFSKNKTPYKTRQHAVIEAGASALYVGIDAQGLHVGGGMFQPPPEVVRRFRDAAADAPGTTLAKVLSGLRKNGFEVGGDQLKRIPKPWDDSHPRAELLRHKSLIAWIDHEPAPWLHTSEALRRVAADWASLKPLNVWLSKHC